MVETPPFRSHMVISEQVSELSLRGYHVGFDQGVFRLAPLGDVISDVIPEFALGYPGHMSVLLSDIRRRLKEAAIKIYNTEKYSKRGEFGELILHLLLRDHFGSIPLISKIYFKDSPNDTVKGFDGVHIVETEEESQLWLGESKLYSNGAKGVSDLAQDVINHFQADYLRQEFSLISSKLPDSWDRVEEWRNRLDEYNRLEDILDRVCVPLACTYTSDLFRTFSADSVDYFTAFEEECQRLYESLQSNIPNSQLDIILLLLPVESKEELVDYMHKKLRTMQGV